MKGTRESFESNGVPVGDASRLRAGIRSIELMSGDQIQFPPSAVTVIVGANNAGKSSLLRQLVAFLRGGFQLVQNERPRLILNGEVERFTSREDLVDWLLQHAQ